MSRYQGVRVHGDIEVYKDGRIFSPAPSQRVMNHSPDGFEWGYYGSGPAQLALAIILEESQGDEEKAFDLYQYFKEDIVAKFPHDRWSIDSQDVAAWMIAHQNREHLEYNPSKAEKSS